MLTYSETLNYYEKTKMEFKLTIIGDPHIEGRNGFNADKLADNLEVPTDSDMLFVLGDMVYTGLDEEYAEAIRWCESLKIPLAMVRGNHDNGIWHSVASQTCMPLVAAQLSHKTPKMGMVLWQPMIWREMDGPILLLPTPKDWRQLPVEIQGQIVKMKDFNPAYYTFEAGDMFFICLDTYDWQLGTIQMNWLKQQLENATKPVVLVGHHHFLPVDIIFDTCQIHERDFLRELVLDDKNNIIAYLHGHTHKDCWLKYGNVDIISVRNLSQRNVIFQDGKVVSCDLDGKKDYSNTFQPRYLCAQTFCSAQICYLEDQGFHNPWSHSTTPCLGWHSSDAKNVEIIWSMLLPSDIGSTPCNLSFQIRSNGMTILEITAPGKDDKIIKEIPPCVEGTTVKVAIGPLKKGRVEAKLCCREGWGYTSIPASLQLS